MSSKLYGILSTRRTLIFFALLTILLYIGISTVLFLGNVPGSDIISLQFAFSKAKVIKLIEKWGTIGTKFVLYSMFIDFMYPLAYSALISSVIANVMERQNVKPRDYKAVFAPFIAALLDYIENIMEIIIINSLEDVSESFVFLASIISTLKWLLIAIFITYASYITLKAWQSKTQT